MDALDRHKARVQRLQQALDRLTALHAQVYDLQGEIVALSKSDSPGRVERLDTLHRKVAALHPEIERTKRELTERGE
jgi:type II secretory pathway component PulM